MDEFASLTARIEEAYDALGHRLGWRFLNGPASTLTSDPHLAFVGLNPGGSVHHPPAPSVEEGFAYRVERWGAKGTLNPLQVQVALLFEGLAERLGRASAAEVMDATLAANLCPFRSPSWEALAAPTESLAFSRQLWLSMLGLAQPRAYLCLGSLAARQVGEVLELGGWRRRGAERNLPAGWGSVTYGVTTFRRADVEASVVRLPHLSRFGIFGRPASAQAVDQLLETTATAVAAG